MAVRQHLKAACFAIGLFGLAACGSEPVDPAAFDAEVQRLADDGDMYGQMFIVLQDRRPQLYSTFRKIALQEYSRGRTPREAGYLAGLRMREKFVAEILQLSRVASDEDVREIIQVMIATYEHLNEENVADCVRLIKGEPLDSVKEFPSDLRKRETQLIIDLLSAPQTVENRRAASQKEVLNWTMNVATLEPSVKNMLTQLSTEKPSKTANQDICEGTITLYKRLSYKKGQTRGALLRGMALMALQQQQIERNLNADESA
ncbi:MAG: hypothetical protein NXH72_14580 [Hyphomonadaceae bacterium]|nr:hypothetical protein [Hyphomonadaceae bacterium]